VHAGPVPREMTTPTGAALLVSSVDGFGDLAADAAAQQRIWCRRT
jgi:uncharacterized protein (DUF111 family)